jgi:hypothetical protein
MDIINPFLHIKKTAARVGWHLAWFLIHLKALSGVRVGSDLVSWCSGNDWIVGTRGRENVSQCCLVL